MPLVMTMMAMTLLTALGSALIVVTITETAIAAAHRNGTELFYAADGAADFAVQEVAAAPDWDELLSSGTLSAFVDGAPVGPRQIGAIVLDLSEATADTNAVAVPGPDGSVPVYRLYGYGRLAQLTAGGEGPLSPYVIVWLADATAPDAEERVVSLFVRSFGPTGGQRSIAVSIGRTPATDEGTGPILRVVSWHAVQ
jgi:hypothetical protein